MVEMVLERDFDTPISAAEVRSGADLGCLSLHRVGWRCSLLSLDGRKMICSFQAADAESVRIALRMGGADIRRLWAGSIHEAPRVSVPLMDRANVLVRRSFEQPVAIAEIQAREDSGAWCLDARQVTFVRTYFSRDRKRMVCLYHAPDAESVREAQRSADMPMDDVWAFSVVAPAA
ncbi:MAG: DUF4242 domain-containing protein [Rhodocyclaceae bacterium]|nr:DUF4242 domain-containing protein [Rhodocyclaceae bacterium]